jgi:hypothetical protein
MWTAHNEIEAKWDYIRAYDMGWINRTALPHEVDTSSMFSANPNQLYFAKTEAEGVSFLQ